MGDPVLDREARGELGEIRLLRLVVGAFALSSRLRAVSAEHAAPLTDDLAQVDALDGAVTQLDLGRAAERALHGVHRLARRGDVERDVALAFQAVLLREVAQDRAYRDALELFFQRYLVLVRIDGELTGNGALVELGRVRGDGDTAVRGVELGVDLCELEPAHLECADLDAALGVDTLQRGEIDR